MRWGIPAAVVALLALVVALGASAELDELQFRLHEGQSPQQRWDRLADRPWVRPPAAGHADSGDRVLRLDAGQAVTLLLPGGADLLLRDRGDADSDAFAGLRVALSQDGAAWVTAQPEPRGDGHRAVPAPGNDAYLARVQAPASGPVRLAAFHARTVPVPTQRLYRYDITPDPGHRLRIGARRAAVRELEPGERVAIEVAGPTRLAFRHRRLARRPSADLQSPYRLVMGIDGQRQRVYRGRTRTERSAVARLDGRIARVSTAETAYLQVPEGEHTVTVEASARTLLRVRRRPADDDLLSRPANWIADPGDLYGELATTGPGDDIRDDPTTVPGLARAWRARLRTARQADAGLGAAASLRAQAEDTPFPDAVRRAASDLRGGHSSWRDLMPRNAGEAAWSTVYARPGGLRGPLARPQERPVMTTDEVPARAAALRTQTLSALGGTAPARLHYRLPEREAPAELRLYAARGRLDRPVTLALHFDSAPTRRVRITPSGAPAAPAPEAAPAMAALRQLTPEGRAGPAAGGLLGTLGARFSALGTSAPLVRSAVATVELPRAVRRVTVEHRSGPGLPVGIAYRKPHALELDERAYTHAVQALGGPDAARQVFRAQLRRRVAGEDPSRLDSPFAEALTAHWTRLADFLAARYADYAVGIHERGHRFQAPGKGSTGRDVRALARRAAGYEADGHWAAAAEAWGTLAGRAGGAIWREAEMDRIRALRQVGATGLADRLLRGFHLYSDDPSMRDRAFQRLRQTLGGADQGGGVWIGAHVAQALRTDELAPLGGVVELLLERGQEALARDLAALLPAGAVPDAARARAFYAGGWPRAAARAGERLEPARAARLEALEALRAGDTAGAQEILQAHAANAPWAQALQRGQAVADDLRDPATPPDPAAWAAWAQDHPGPRAWAPAQRLVSRAAGTRTLRALRRDTRVTMALATPEQPVHLTAPAGQLRLTFRLQMASDARDASGWVRLAAGGRTRRLPVTATGPAAGLVPLGGAAAVGPGNRYTVALEGTAGRVTVAPDRPMLVRVEWRRPSLRLPVLPEPWPSVMAAGLEQRDRDGPAACRAEVDVADPASGRVRRVCGTEAGLAAPLPDDPGSALPGGVALAPAEDPAVALADALAQCPAPYGACPGLGRRIYARALSGDPSPLLTRLRGMVGPYFGWERVEQVAASAGVRTVEVAGWQPQSPQLRARTPFLGRLDGNDHVLSGPGRLYLDFVNRQATTLVLDLRSVDMPTRPAEPPATLDYRLDDGPWRSAEVPPGGRRVAVAIGPGRHTIALRVERPTQERYLIASVQERRQDGLEPLVTPVERSYQVATRAEPARFAVDGPALVRVDRYREDGIVSAYREVPADQSRVRVTPEAGRSEALVRVYALRHRGAVPESAPRYELSRPQEAPERALAVEGVPETAAPLGERPLHGQGEGTTSVGGGYRLRDQVEDEPGGTGDRDGFLELRLDRRRYDAVADRFDQGGLRLRLRGDGRPTLGGTARVLFPDRVLGAADGWPLDLTLRGSAFVQRTEAEGPEAALTVRAAARHRRQVAERTWLSGRLDAFARHLTLDAGLPGSETADSDVFTRYKADHPVGWGLRAGIEHRPFLDTTLYGRLGGRTNADLGLSDPDNVYAEAGLRQFLGGVQLDLSYRATRYLADGDRGDAVDTGRLGLDVGYDLWRPAGDRVEATGRIRRDVRRSRTSFGLFLTWHFGGGQTLGRHELGNGRLLRDFRPDAEAFRTLREARAPGWEADR